LPTRSSKRRFDAAAIMFPFSMKLSPPNISTASDLAHAGEIGADIINQLFFSRHYDRSSNA
jgi:hypothetical protein